MNTPETISQLANQCVMCGLCLPHCPTYKLFRDENESPRGRISLLKAMAENQLDINAAFIQHIDRCLSCRACESMCPSKVQYANIINLGREMIADTDNAAAASLSHQSGIEKILLNKSSHVWIKKVSSLTAMGGKVTGKLLNKLGDRSSLSRLAAIASEMSGQNALQPSYPVKEPITSVALFTGCVGELFNSQALQDMIELLNACQIEVVVPEQQGCCGALSQRHGNAKQQTLLARQNLAAFDGTYSAILSLANSCSAQLQEYAYNTRLQTLDRQRFALQIKDSIAYLNTLLNRLASDADNPSPVAFTPLNDTVLVHTSCSLKNVLHAEQQLVELLGHIPNIQLKLLDDKYCCGAAGSYMLKYPDIADKLIEQKIDDIITSGSQIIVSSNMGCSLHIKQRLLQLDYAAEIVHPVSLLLKQLKKK